MIDQLYESKFDDPYQAEFEGTHTGKRNANIKINKVRVDKDVK
jgi:hypothetical protein